MQLENINRTYTNTVLKCYISVPSFLVEKVEREGTLHEGENPYVQVRVEGCSITVYDPTNFAESAVYSITVNRKKVSEKVYNHITFSNWEWQNKEGAFEQCPPVITDMAVITSVIHELSEAAAEFLTPSAEEPAVVVTESKFVRFGETFWRKAGKVAPSGEYRTGGFTIRSIIDPSSGYDGVCEIRYCQDYGLFEILETEETETATTEEVAEWVKNITGWCDDVDRWFS